jgi:subtilisin
MSRRFVAAVLTTLGLAVPTAMVAAQGPVGPMRERVIVVLEPGVDARGFAATERSKHGAELSFVYQVALNGFAATVPAGRVEALRHDPRVAYVEPDLAVSVDAQSTPTGVRRIFTDANSDIGIDGIDDQRVDVDVAVLDTGIDGDHPDLNVVDGVTCLSSIWEELFGIPATCVADGGDDDHYHGTHVAGTIGALDNGIGVVGVAPGARLHSVKVLDSRGSGYVSGIVAGIDWIVDRGDIEVANMSLGGAGLSTAYQQALAAAKQSGVAFAVAAGNDGADASGYSPAAYGAASYGRLVLTVSALADFDGAPGGTGSATCRSDQDDTFANFSNFGNAVGIIAPGVCILSTYPLEQGGYGTISGTSMATPHVAGGLALLASNSPIGPTSDASSVDALFDTLIGLGNSGWNAVDDGDALKEPLLDVSAITPTLVAGSGGGGDGGGGGSDGGDVTAPSVTIIEPGPGATFPEGDAITFAGDASDDADPTVSADDLVWTIDGTEIATGASTTATLGVGTHAVVASATDASGNTGTATIDVTVEADPGTPPAGDIELSVAVTKERGRNYTVNLSWTSASGDVDIWRDFDRIAAGYSGSSYDDAVAKPRGGTYYLYMVCPAGADWGTSACSNEVIVAF